MKQPNRRKKGTSVFDLYPLPFLDRKAEHPFWNVESTGSYTKDCALGQQLAIELFLTCDRTIGWVAFLRWIILDMIAAGPASHTKGIQVGFLGEVARAVVHSRVVDRCSSTPGTVTPFKVVRL
jgi:hypothetical protein